MKGRCRYAAQHFLIVRQCRIDTVLRSGVPTKKRPRFRASLLGREALGRTEGRVGSILAGWRLLYIGAILMISAECRGWRCTSTSDYRHRIAILMRPRGPLGYNERHG